jgi:hypothetical protein
MKPTMTMLTIRLPIAEAEIIRACARRWGVSTNEWLRMIAAVAAVQKAAPPDGKPELQRTTL